MTKTGVWMSRLYDYELRDYTEAFEISDDKPWDCHPFCSECGEEALNEVPVLSRYCPFCGREMKNWREDYE